MALLSRKIDYALLILSYLHHTPEGGCARAIADRFGLSRAFVANILKTLCCKGFVVSERGMKGGYALQKAPADVSLADLIDSLEGPFQLTECCQESPDDGCQLFGRCPVQGSVAEAHRRVRDVLASVTLAELVGAEPRPGTGPVDLETQRCRTVASVGSDPAW